MLQHCSAQRTLDPPALAAVAIIILIMRVFNICVFKVFNHHLVINSIGDLTRADWAEVITLIVLNTILL